MPNIFQRMGNWFSNQRQAYRVQQAIAARDSFIAATMREHESIVAGINADPALNNLQKQERQANALLDFYKRPDDPTGKSYQLSEFRQSVADAGRNLSFAAREPDSTSLGARLGRLFSGRSNTEVRRQAEANRFKFESEYAVPDKYAQRGQIIRADRTRSENALAEVKNYPESYEKRTEAYYKAIAADQTAKYNATTDADRERFSAMTTDEKKALTVNERLRLGAKLPPDPINWQWETAMRSAYPFERQTQAFMKPGDANNAHNLRVLQTFCNLDKNGKARDQAFAEQVITGAMDKFRNFDATRVNIRNPQANYSSYAEMESMYTMGHAIMDMTKANGGILTDRTYRGIFPDQQSRWSFNDKVHFVMSASQITRGAMLQYVDYDPKYSLARERTWQQADPRQALREQAEKYDAQRDSNTYLGGKTSYGDFANWRAENAQTWHEPDARLGAPQVEVATAQTERIAVSLGQIEGAPKIAEPIAAHESRQPQISGPQR